MVAIPSPYIKLDSELLRSLAQAATKGTQLVKFPQVTTPILISSSQEERLASRQLKHKITHVATYVHLTPNVLGAQMAAVHVRVPDPDKEAYVQAALLSPLVQMLVILLVTATQTAQAQQTVVQSVLQTARQGQGADAHCLHPREHLHAEAPVTPIQTVQVQQAVVPSVKM